MNIIGKKSPHAEALAKAVAPLKRGEAMYFGIPTEVDISAVAGRYVLEGSSLRNFNYYDYVYLGKQRVRGATKYILTGNHTMLRMLLGQDYAVHPRFMPLDFAVNRRTAPTNTTWQQWVSGLEEELRVHILKRDRVIVGRRVRTNTSLSDPGTLPGMRTATNGYEWVYDLSPIESAGIWLGGSAPLIGSISMRSLHAQGHYVLHFGKTKTNPSTPWRTNSLPICLRIDTGIPLSPGLIDKYVETLKAKPAVELLRATGTRVAPTDALGEDSWETV